MTRVVRLWRWLVPASWVVVVVLMSEVLGPAGPQKPVNGLQSGLALVAMLGGLIAAIFVAFGRTPGLSLSIGAAASGVVATSLDLGRSTGLASVEALLFLMAMALSSVAWRVGRSEIAVSHPGHAVAWDDPQVRHQVRHSRIQGWTILGVGVVAFVGFVAGVDHVESHSEQLMKTGTRVPGTVVAREPPSRFSAGSIRVTYRVAGITRNARVYLTDSSPSYSIGESVTVAVNRAQPTDVTVDGSDNQSPPQVMVLVLLLILSPIVMVFGVMGLRDVGRLRVALSTSGWERVPVQTGKMRYGRSFRTVLRVRSGDALSRWMGLSIWHRPSTLRTIRAQHQVQIAGPGAGPLAFRLPDGRIVSSRTLRRTHFVYDLGGTDLGPA